MKSITVDYCQFAPWGYHKPTQVWGTVDHITNVQCDGHTCPNMTLQLEPRGRARWKHRVRLEGTVVSLKEKYRIPERLIEYLNGWRQPPSTEELSAEIALFVATEPPHRQEENRPQRPNTTITFITTLQ